MNTFDLLMVVIATISFLYGLYKGFVMELSSLVGIFFGAWGASHWSHVAEGWLRQFSDFEYISIVAFVVTLIALVVLVHFVAVIVNRLVNITILSLPNRLLGGVLGGLKSLFVVSCLLFAVKCLCAGSLPLLDDAKEDSRTYAYVEALAPSVIPYFDLNIGSWADNTQHNK